MEPVFLTKLVSNSNDWLSVRQATIAENIANANTPGFRSKDLEPFTTVISRTQLAMSYTCVQLVVSFLGTMAGPMSQHCAYEASDGAGDD